MKRSLLLPCLVLLVALSPLSALRSQGSGISLPRAALQLQDVPAGLHLNRAFYVSNQEAASKNHVSLATMRAMRRVTGYFVEFNRPPQTGICCVSNSLVRYASSGGAARGYRFYRARDRRTWNYYPGYHEATRRKGQLFEYTFPCTCFGHQEVVDDAQTHVGTYYVAVELHFIPRTANPAAMMRTTVRYVDIVAKRLR